MQLPGQAAVVIGIHGADLTNCVFMQKGAALLELNPWYWSDARFLRACGTNDVHYLSYNEVDVHYKNSIQYSLREVHKSSTIL